MCRRRPVLENLRERKTRRIVAKDKGSEEQRSDQKEQQLQDARTGSPLLVRVTKWSFSWSPLSHRLLLFSCLSQCDASPTFRVHFALDPSNTVYPFPSLLLYLDLNLSHSLSLLLLQLLWGWSFSQLVWKNHHHCHH